MRPYGSHLGAFSDSAGSAAHKREAKREMKTKLVRAIAAEERRQRRDARREERRRRCELRRRARLR